jgi:cytochrome b561
LPNGYFFSSRSRSDHNRSPQASDRAFASSVKKVHEVLAHAPVAPAGPHAAAVLIHHRVFQDRTLTPWLEKWSQVARTAAEGT